MITKSVLIGFGFLEKIQDKQIYFEKNGFIVQPEFGKRLFCINHSGLVISGLTLIETIVELKREYYESLGKELN